MLVYIDIHMIQAYFFYLSVYLHICNAFSLGVYLFIEVQHLSRKVHKLLVMNFLKSDIYV